MRSESLAQFSNSVKRFRFCFKVGSNRFQSPTDAGSNTEFRVQWVKGSIADRRFERSEVRPCRRLSKFRVWCDHNLAPFREHDMFCEFVDWGIVVLRVEVSMLLHLVSKDVFCIVE